MMSNTEGIGRSLRSPVAIIPSPTSPPYVFKSYTSTILHLLVTRHTRYRNSRFRQIRGTIRTRARKVAELQFGRWYYETPKKKLPDLIASFHADDKRIRETYDSYGLCRENRWIPSRSLTAAEFYEVKLKSENQTATKLPSGQRYSVDFVKQWTREYGETEQTVPWLR